MCRVCLPPLTKTDLTTYKRESSVVWTELITRVMLEFLVVFFWRMEKLSGFRLCYPFISVSWWKWKGLRVSSDFTSCFISNNSSSCQTDDGFHWWTAYRIFVDNGREQKKNHIGSLDFWYCHVDRWGILLFANPACCLSKPCCLTGQMKTHRHSHFLRFHTNSSIFTLHYRGQSWAKYSD